MVFNDLFPLTNTIGLPLGKDDQAKFVFDFFKKDRDFRTGLRNLQFILFAKLLNGDHSLTLVADVDQHIVAFDSQHGSFDDCVEFVGIGCGIVDRIHVSGCGIDFLE